MADEEIGLAQQAKPLPRWIMAGIGLLLVLLGGIALVDLGSYLVPGPVQYWGLQALTGFILFIAWLTRYNTPLSPQPAWGGWVLAALGGIVHAAAALLAIKTLYWGSFIVIAAGSFWALFGREAFRRRMAFFLFAFFLLPDMPSDIKLRISLPLQMLSTQLSAGLAGLLIPVETAGNVFYINGEAFEVTVACSGLHTWIGFLFAGLLWFLFEGFDWRKFMGVLIAAPVLALVLNTVRLFVTALVAWYQSADAAIAVHTNLDFVLFPVGLALLALLLVKLPGGDMS